MTWKFRGRLAHSSVISQLGAVLMAVVMLAGAMLAGESAANAQTPAVAASPAPIAAAPAAVTPANATANAAEPAYVPMKPTPGKGQPVDGGINFQDQYTETGADAFWLHDSVLLPLIAAISVLVLGLLFWVAIRYRAAANPVPSKTTHNSLIEVLWTGIPVLILVFISVPSISLVAKQYTPAPKDALTVKVTGEQWFWTYNYPDNGGFDVVSNLLPDEQAVARGEPAQLAVDNRMVVPAGEPIRLQITSPAGGVIHSFAVPSLWFKLDAVPGKLNERMLTIKEPGVYYGQCSELCGARHGYMPIAVEALPRPQFEAWVRQQGGTVGNADAPAAAAAVVAPTAPAAATPAAAGAK